MNNYFSKGNFKCFRETFCFRAILSLVCGFFFICAFFICFSGCGKNVNCTDSKNTANENNGKLNVLVTIFPLYDMVSQVTKNSVNLKMLIPPGVDSHSFEPTPETLKLIENCDVLFYLGGDVDLWVEKILNSFNNQKKSRIKSVNMMQNLGYLSSKDIDPHVWTSLQNMIKMAEISEKNLAQISSKSAPFFAKNLSDFITKLNDLRQKYLQVVAGSKRRTLVFADKFPFKHFVEEFALNAISPFANCSSKAEPLSARVVELIDFVKENKVPIILKTDFSEKGLAETIANETGAQVRVFHSCHNVSYDDFSENKTYLYFMTKNLETLKEALN